MTFKHKLSCRLALLKDRRLAVSLAVLAAAAAFACEKPLQVTDTGVTSLSQLLVSPKVVTVQVNQLTSFMAVGLTSTGDTVAATPVSWSVTGGSITDTSSSGGRHYGHYKAASAPGQYKVIAADHSSNASDTATVTVIPVPVASVSVSPPSASVLVGGTVSLVATTLDSAGGVLTGRAVTWSSSNTGIATVNGSGVVTALAPGSSTMTATSEGKSGTASVAVSSVPVASVTVAPATASPPVGQTVQLTATPQDASGNPLSGRVITWSSTSTTVATVSGSGLVTARAAGSATITATSEGQSGTAAITVPAPAPVASVSVSPATASVPVGQTVQLTATPQDASGNPLSGRVITWSSSSTTVATVSGSGLVTARAAGSATITATSEGQSGTAAITVPAPAPVASVSVSPASATLQIGQTVQLTATPKDANGNPLTGRTITWGSSNTAVATVTGSGLVTGVVAGSATITATSEGQSGTAAITVPAPAPVASVSVNPASASVQVGQTVQLVATPKDASGNPLTGRTVTWGSSNTAVATVTASGLVTGLVVGSATITATSEGQSASSAITVTAPAAGNIYYTATTGLDGNAGTLTSPFKTIAKGASVLKPGDKLYIRGGTYVESLVNSVPSGTSWTSPVTLAAYPGETVVVQASGSVVVRINSSVGYIIFDGLIFDAARQAGPVVYLDNLYGSGTPHHIRFQNGEIKNAASSDGALIEASYTDPQPNYNEFINMKIHDNGSSVLHHGIYMHSSHNLVTGCDIYNNSGFGVQIYHDNAASGINTSYNTLSGNKLHDNVASGAVLAGGVGNLAYNNLIWNNRGGILVDYSASNTGLYYNTIYANNAGGGVAGIRLGSNVSASNTTIRDNIIFGNSAGDITTYSATNTVADHNIMGGIDPKFRNTASFDFHLQLGSPAIGAGVAVTGLTADFDGVARPQGSSYDPGGYEYVP